MCAENVWYITQFYSLFSTKTDPDEGSLIPVDVLAHGDQFGLKCVKFWPQLSHRHVVDSIDSLKKKFKQDFDRVNKFYLI